MKKKYLAAALVALSLTMTACGATGGETSATATPEVTATPEATATAAPTAEATATPIPMKTISIKSDSATSVEIELENATGADIQSIVIQAEDAEQTAENLLASDDLFVKGEKRVLHFDPKADTDYHMELTTADGAVVTLHDFPLTDAESAVLKAEGETGYLVYTSVETKKEVNTLEAEKTLLVEAAAYTEPAYTEPEYTEPEYSEPEYTEPEYSEPEYTEPEPPADNGGDGEGCLNGALFN